MRKFISLSIFLFFVQSQILAQDTFSIVALDTATGEVGSAGASCLDLFTIPSLTTNDFIGELFPGQGAINCQAYYIPQNQINARNRMQLGQSPSQIIGWLTSNDAGGQATLRQYGIVGYSLFGNPESAAYTGINTDNYKGHRTGYNYSIQGNILLGPEVLDSMESRFQNAEGDLACKLMAAMQGANMVGADSRCTSNGTSSLFAYLKVAQPSDTFGDPTYKISLRTSNGAGIEPIDSLQSLFNLSHDSCESLSPVAINNPDFNEIKIFPNPVKNELTIELNGHFELEISIFNHLGIEVNKSTINGNENINVSNFKTGTYFMRYRINNKTYTKSFIKN